MKTTRSIRVFQTETQYNNVKNTFEYPTVAYVRGTDTVHYMEKPYDYGKDYLTFEALENGTFTLNIPANVNSTYMTSVSYSTDNGTTWTDTTIDNTAQTITTPTINAGNKVLWKGVGKKMAASASQASNFSSTGNFNVSGNIMSLLHDDFQGNNEFDSDAVAIFHSLFKGTKLIKANSLILPATTLTMYCYFQMFSGCRSLITAPELPATTLANSCYYSMFSGCSSLTTAPSILPATTLADYCYVAMFTACGSLTTAPILPATTLVNGCYNGMFSYCTQLNYIKAMFTTTPSTSYTGDWVSGVAATGTFVKNNAAAWNVTGTNGIPTGWTVQTAAS